MWRISSGFAKLPDDMYHGDEALETDVSFQTQLAVALLFRGEVVSTLVSAWDLERRTHASKQI